MAGGGIFDLLDTSLSADRERDGELTAAMIRRIGDLASYAERPAPPASCSPARPSETRSKPPRGPAACRSSSRTTRCLTRRSTPANGSACSPRSAERCRHGGRVPCRRRATRLGGGIETVCVAGAMAALKAGNADEHNGLLAVAAPRLALCDAVLLAHFSTARAEDAVRAAISRPVLTAPGAAVEKLKTLLA